MKQLDGKVVLITGVSAGIGRATAKLFAGEGAKIVGGDVDEVGGGSLSQEIQNSGGQMTFQRADVSKVEDIKALLAMTENLGGIDILFNNAGIEVAKSILDTTESDWETNINVNLKSVFFSCKHAIEQMKAKGEGIIINNSSVAGIVGSFSPAYSAAKGGIIALTKALAVDYGKYNIRVNCIAPGAIETPMLKRVLEYQGEPIEVRDQRIRNYPLGRFGNSLEVAKTALFLASDDSGFISGATIIVDGGFSAK